MTFAAVLLIVLATVVLGVGAIRGWFVASLGVVGTVFFSLGIVQGDESPLVLLRSAPVSIFALSVIVLSALLSRLFASMKRRRDVVIVWVTSVFSVSMIVSAVFLISVGQQWNILVYYLVLLWFPFLFSFSFRAVPLVGLALGSFYQVAVALVGGYYVPTLSGVPQLSAGVQPNILALQAALVSICGLHIGLHQNLSNWGRFIGYVVFVAGAISIVLTVSRSGLISTIIAVGFFVILSVRSRMVAVSVLSSVALLSFLIIGGYRAPWMEQWFVRGDAESISSLTGRTDIWDLAISMVSDKPFFGWGFGALYRDDFSGGFFLRMVNGTNAHNAWLQVAVECGLFGLVCFLFLFSKICRQFWALRKLSEGRFYLAVTCLLTVNSFVSASFGTIGFAALIFAALLAVSSWRRYPPISRRCSKDSGENVSIPVMTPVTL